MLGDRVSDQDRVRVQGRDKKQRPVYAYLLVNKPPGIGALELINYDIPLYQVGRFDFYDEGLVILTNDEIFANRLEHPRHAFEREYVVQVESVLTLQDIKKLQNGMKLGNKQTLPAQVRKMDETRFAIVLKDGDQKQIRIMVESLGYKIVSLKRTRFLSLKMQSTYPEGNWRYLTEKEVEELNEAMGVEKKKPNFKLHKK